MKKYTIELRVGTDINPTTHSWVHITNPDGRSEAWGFFDDSARPEDINKPYFGDDDPSYRDAPTEMSEFQYLKLQDFIKNSIAKPEEHLPDNPAEISYLEYLELCKRNEGSIAKSKKNLPDAPPVTSESEYLKFLNIIKSSRPKPRKKPPLPHYINFRRSMNWALDAFEVGTNPIEPSPCAPQTKVTRERLRRLSQQQILKKLKTLQERNAPEPIKMGAMCYSRAPPSPSPLQVEYVYPKCGEKTIYSMINKNTKFDEREVKACRREIAILQRNFGISLTLDESSFCAHCSPSSQEPQLALIMRFEDGSIRDIANISSHDLIIMRAFFEGQLTYESSRRNAVLPLKPVLPRLRELLGINDEDVG